MDSSKLLEKLELTGLTACLAFQQDTYSYKSAGLPR